MFVLSTLVYPLLLAVLCLAAGLLVDRVATGFLPGALLPIVGAAALIAVAQLAAALPALAPATGYLLAGVAAAGLVLGRRRACSLVRSAPAHRWQAAVPVLAYVLGLAAVLLAGRPTFSGYGVLPDSALHMIGADYLNRHGHDFTGLDLRNSYGQYIDAYFNHSYPSGAHTLLGASAHLLGLPLIWALQPFCAFILASAAGPAWILARRVGLDGAWAGVAALAVTLPALVYGYELVASLKEVTALPLILGLGALVTLHPAWLRGRAAAGIPFALLAAGGLSAFGAAFGAWVLAAVAVLAAVVVGDAAARRHRLVAILPLVLLGAAVGLAAALPTLADAAGSLQVAQNIAVTSNPGNLTVPLHLEQVFGAWISGSYRHRPPIGAPRLATYGLAFVTLLAALLGAARLIRIRARALGGWLALLLVLWLGLTAYGTTWADAKLLMLTSPVVVLLAFAGVAAVRASPLRVGAPLLAAVIGGGVIASDVAQYHSTDLAPTARYTELASLNTRFAGRGPALFTDFDEWSVYVLRNVDVGGPDFVFPPVGLAAVASGHGEPVDLDRISPAALLAYPLIITRRDPAASRPPSAYELRSEGTYYQVWVRRPGAPAASVHLRLSGTRPIGCVTAQRLAAQATAPGAHLVSATPVATVAIDLARARHPSWSPAQTPRLGLAMTRHGRLDAAFTVPTAGVWNVWLRGQFMPAVTVSVDGRSRGSIGAQVGGSQFHPDPAAPLRLVLTVGRHRLRIARGGLSLAPGNGGSAFLQGVFLTPAGAQEQVRVTRPAQWRSLCGGRFDWIEVTPA